MSNTNSKTKLQKVIRFTQLGSAIATGCEFVFLDAYPDSPLVIGSLYLLAEVRSCLNAILIALLLNDDGDRETDKRPFALVNAGAPLAGIISGIFIGAEATVLSSSTLLLLCCGFDLIAWAIISRPEIVSRALISARKRIHDAAPTVDALTDQHQQSLSQSLSLGKLILSVVVCKTVVLTLIDYEWKVFAADHYSASEAELTSYFGVFYAVSDGLTLIFQLVIAKYFFFASQNNGVGVIPAAHLLDRHCNGHVFDRQCDVAVLADDVCSRQLVGTPRTVRRNRAGAVWIAATEISTSNSGSYSWRCKTNRRIGHCRQHSGLRGLRSRSDVYLDLATRLADLGDRIEAADELLEADASD